MPRWWWWDVKGFGGRVRRSQEVHSSQWTSTGTAAPTACVVCSVAPCRPPSARNGGDGVGCAFTYPWWRRWWCGGSFQQRCSSPLSHGCLLHFQTPFPQYHVSPRQIQMPLLTPGRAMAVDRTVSQREMGSGGVCGESEVDRERALKRVDVGPKADRCGLVVCRCRGV